MDEAGGTITVTRESDDRIARSVHGLTRALAANMVEGVSKGYEKRLEIVGVGYLAAIQKDSSSCGSALPTSCMCRSRGPDRHLP